MATEPGADGGEEQLKHRVLLGRQVHEKVMEGRWQIGKGPFVCEAGLPATGLHGILTGFSE
ncbi:hypothetical protein BR1R5_50140 [Pseudomonas sp. BR1R-5]|nr:hypothetical protein BR1R5_50140 [Pseudomonas sp. BR1R-5]